MRISINSFEYTLLNMEEGHQVIQLLMTNVRLHSDKIIALVKASRPLWLLTRVDIRISARYRWARMKQLPNLTAFVNIAGKNFVGNIGGMVRYDIPLQASITFRPRTRNHANLNANYKASANMFMNIQDFKPPNESIITIHMKDASYGGPFWLRLCIRTTGNTWVLIGDPDVKFTKPLPPGYFRWLHVNEGTYHDDALLIINFSYMETITPEPSLSLFTVPVIT